MPVSHRCRPKVKRPHWIVFVIAIVSILEMIYGCASLAVAALSHRWKIPEHWHLHVNAGRSYRLKSPRLSPFASEHVKPCGRYAHCNAHFRFQQEVRQLALRHGVAIGISELKPLLLLARNILSTTKLCWLILPRPIIRQVVHADLK